MNAEHPGIVRKPACELEDDTDLGDRLVTVSVPDLPPEVVAKALDRGVEFARNLFNAGRIEAAYLALQHATRTMPQQRREGLA